MPGEDGGMATRLARVSIFALNLLLPPRCLGCGRLIEEQGTLCAPCWKGLTFIAAPFCVRCGYPFEFEAGEELLCPACLREPPGWDRARSVFRYDDASRGLILAFKYADRTDAARTFAAWLLRAGRELIEDADLIVPVPLHWTRLFARRYNQAALLGSALAKLSGKPMDPGVLVRKRRTPSQRGLDRNERRSNVRKAFAVPARQAGKLADKGIVLIDDVLTTGATAGSCAAALLRAGARSVDVLTLARTVLPRS